MEGTGTSLHFWIVCEEDLHVHVDKVLNDYSSRLIVKQLDYFLLISLCYRIPREILSALYIVFLIIC